MPVMKSPQASVSAPLVLVVEDEPGISTILVAYLERDGLRAQLAQDGQEAVQLFRQFHPDLVLLDIHLPAMDGIDVLRAIRDQGQTPVIMVTALADDVDKLVALRLGADDYVVKPFNPPEVVARVRAVLRRRAPHLADEAVEIGTLMLNPATHRVLAAGQPIELGPTEFRLLFFFMTHTERVYTRAQLLDEVWGDHIFIEERTVDVHIRRLRSALEASGNHERVETVRGTGYRFSGA